MNVEHRKTVNINLVLTAGTSSSFDMPIQLQFVPDDLFAKQLIVTTASNNREMYQVTLNLIDDQILASFIDVTNNIGADTQIIPQNILLNSQFYIGKQVNSTFTVQIQKAPFNLTASSGTGLGPVATDLDATLQIILEFVKYKK